MSKSDLHKFLDFIPAELHANKEWYISYYVKNPWSGEMVRKQIRCNRIKSITERRAYSKKLVAEINSKLKEGWNPFLEHEASKAFHRLSSAFDKFIKMCDRALKEDDLRPDTVRSYKSYIKILSEWLSKHGKENMYVINFTKSLANEFLNDIYLTRDLKAISYNNYLVNLRVIFNWLKQYDYISINPFAEIRKKKTGHKERIQYIDIKTRFRIKEHLEQNNYPLMVMCLLAYHTLIRPKEITYLKVGDIDLENQQIFVSGKYSKNKQDRYTTIPNVFVDVLRNMHSEPYDKDLYLFSSKLNPGRTRLDPRRIAQLWVTAREKIGLDPKYKFYSLRDSGIIQKIKDGIPLDEVMYQADHHSLEVTNVYVRIADPKIFTSIRDRASEF